MPPEGVPAYSGKLLLPELDEPLEVRFWITSPQVAVDAVAATRHGTEECGRSGHDVLKGVAGFDRSGWRGVQALVTTDAWTEDGYPGAGATIVAARGGLPAEVTWAWPFEVDGEPDPYVLLQGTASATSVPAAVGREGSGRSPCSTSMTRSLMSPWACAMAPPWSTSVGRDRPEAIRPPPFAPATPPSCAHQRARTAGPARPRTPHPAPARALALAAGLAERLRGRPRPATGPSGLTRPISAPPPRTRRPRRSPAIVAHPLPQPAAPGQAATRARQASHIRKQDLYLQRRCSWRN
ncbi:hypothetical protein GCM10010140_60770 [Streptosporangium pseudovulgare]|uniref:Uncharacterized protein n=1 Tax=Streptosporangium pseudovulgare TaxID=35765 RepID=A0ABQ2RAP6_9ACTN|nr:hypothetical protein GCM10010140_60770 [Streptosporangium pseudovulgare]